MRYEIVIGLEVHVELSTRTKLLCGCLNRFGAPPNSLVCPVCLGLPGALPVLNRRAVELHLVAARALGCSVAPLARFDRKNYFYPDIPKNFQTSQYDLPLATGGACRFELAGAPREVALTRIHLEEDTGKSLHVVRGREGVAARLGEAEYTLVDYNRAGVPLLEIVSEPVIGSPEEAAAYLEALRDLLRWLGVSDCKMEEGSLRCDANLSLRPEGTQALGVKAEIKNMNSFRSVAAALAFEARRQRELLEAGGVVRQETRGWDEERGITHPLRGKEQAQDYRYFPEPDLPPVQVSPEEVARVDSLLPALPLDLARRYREELGLSPADAAWLTSAPSLAGFFEQALEVGGPVSPREIATWMANELSRLLRESGVPVERCGLTPSGLVGLLALVEQGEVGSKGARQVAERIFVEGGDPAAWVERLGVGQITAPEALRGFVEAALEASPRAVEEVRAGREKALNVLVGHVMKASGGRAHPARTQALMRARLGLEPAGGEGSTHG